MKTLRMLHWLFAAAAFYALALYVFGAQPQLQTLCWKLGNVTIAAWVGYRIDTNLFRRPIAENSDDLDYIRRAIVVAATMISISLGL